MTYSASTLTIQVQVLDGKDYLLLLLGVLIRFSHVFVGRDHWLTKLIFLCFQHLFDDWYRELAELYTTTDAWLLDVLLDQLLLFMRLLASDSHIFSTLYHLGATNSLVSGLYSRSVRLNPEVLK